jgi:hypothetical protein
MVGGYDKGTKINTPLFQSLDSIIRTYEDLRHGKYFDDSVLAMLRQPGKEFKLYKENNGKWNFKKAIYEKQKVSATGPHAEWKVQNKFNAQPLKLRLEALMALKPYNDPSSITISDFSSNYIYPVKATAKGVTGELKYIAEGPAQGVPAIRFTAKSNGEMPARGSWIMAEKEYSPALNIAKNEGLGVWVKGDGKGAVLNLRLESPVHISHGARGDRYIILDFTGWRYFDLVELESNRFTDYIWPISDLHVYDSYRHNVSFKEITKLQFWINNIPANEEVSVEISPVKATEMVKEKIKTPSIVLNGKKLTFDVTMESGMYIEMYSADDCKLFGPKGHFLQNVRLINEIPVLQTRENNFIFECENDGKVNPRMQVTTISYGEPVISYN